MNCSRHFPPPERLSSQDCVGKFSKTSSNLPLAGVFRRRLARIKETPFENFSILRLLVITMLIGAGVVPFTAQAQQAGEWPSFRGGHSGVAPTLSPIDGGTISLERLWNSETFGGVSSFCVSGHKVFTIVAEDRMTLRRDVLVAHDIKTGVVLWKADLEMNGVRKPDDDGAPPAPFRTGPLSTPVVSGHLVYVINLGFSVQAFYAANGEKRWSREMEWKHYGDRGPGTGLKVVGASPVIDGDVLLLAGGRSGTIPDYPPGWNGFRTISTTKTRHSEGGGLVGLDKLTGEIKWRSENDDATQATPIVTGIHGVRQCIFLTAKGLVSIYPKDGRIFWRGTYTNSGASASPVVWNDIVYCATNRGSAAFKVSRTENTFAAEMLWEREGWCAKHWCTPVVKDGYLYGMFGDTNSDSFKVACVDIRTGKESWSEEGSSIGQPILSGDTIIGLTESGEIVFARATPSAYTELKRQDLLDGAAWSYPAFGSGHLFVRSTTEGGCWKFR